MKFTPYDAPTVIAPTSGMSHFEQSSVIKTAPPGRSTHFSSPKHESLDLAPLSEGGLQDLGKMQPAMEHCYNNGYGRFYNEYAPPALISAAAASQYYPMPSAMFSSGASTAATGTILQQHEWGAIDQYTAYQQRASAQNGANTANGTVSAIHYSNHSASNGNDHSNGGNSVHDHQRAVYKMGAELLSPVDSGLGTDLSVLEPAMIKQEFFAVNGVSAQPTTVQSVLQTQSQAMADLGLERRDNSSSHREHSPVIIPKVSSAANTPNVSSVTLPSPFKEKLEKIKNDSTEFCPQIDHILNTTDEKEGYCAGAEHFNATFSSNNMDSVPAEFQKSKDDSMDWCASNELFSSNNTGDVLSSFLPPLTIEKEIPAKRSKKLPVKNSKKRPVKRSKKLPVKKSKKRPVKRSKKLPEKKSKKVPVKNSKKLPEKKSKKVPVKNSKKLPVKRSKKVPVKNSKKLPVKRSKKVPVKNSKKPPMKRSKKLPVKHSKELPEKNSKKLPVPVQNSKKLPVQNSKNLPVPVRNAKELPVPVRNAKELPVPVRNAKKLPVKNSKKLPMRHSKRIAMKYLKKIYLKRSQTRSVSLDEGLRILRQNSRGFQYTLEAPISTSIRKEDDRMTYVNKGQFYTINLEYVADPCRMFKSATARSVVMVVFRDDKSFDEELKTWQLWHKRQHSPKQRILEVDPKNSQGIIGNIEEVSYNAVQFCWNPAESAQISIAVQCLSTDFSTQKGVKGLPLHVQVDTYAFEDEPDATTPPYHRGYCQIKVFCDKGANRKMLHENRRDERRKGIPRQGGGGGRKKTDGEYHETCDRSEFYHMSDLEKIAALFSPNGNDEFDTRYFDTTALTFADATLDIMEPSIKRPRTERVMIYVRKPGEPIFTPLHLVPPSLAGLYRALAEKYEVDETKIAHVYKQCQKGVTVKVDDDMLRHYSNQDTFIIEIEPLDQSYCAVKLTELSTSNSSPSDCGRPSQQPTPLSQHQWSQQTSNIGHILNTQSHTPQ